MRDDDIRTVFYATKEDHATIMQVAADRMFKVDSCTVAEHNARRAARQQVAPKPQPKPAVQPPLPVPVPVVVFPEVLRGGRSILMSVYDRILAAGIKLGDTINFSQIEAFLEADGYNKTSVSPVASKLIRMGVFARHGRRGDKKVRFVSLARRA